MYTPSPYDLNESAMQKIRECEREKIRNPRKNNLRTLSPYDLPAVGGLTALVERAKLKKIY